MSDAEVRTDEGFQGCRFDRRPESLERATHQAEMGRAYDRGVAAREVAERAWPHRDEGRILGSVEARPKTEAFQESDDGPEGFTCLGPRLTESRPHERSSPRPPGRLDRTCGIATGMSERIDQDLCQQPEPSRATRRSALDDAVAVARATSGTRAAAFLDHETRLNEHAEMPANRVSVQADALRQRTHIEWLRRSLENAEKRHTAAIAERAVTSYAVAVHIVVFHLPIVQCEL